MPPLWGELVIVFKKQIYKPITVNENEIGIILLNVSGIVTEAAERNHNTFLWAVKKPTKLLDRRPTNAPRSTFALNLDDWWLYPEWIGMSHDIYP